MPPKGQPKPARLIVATHGYSAGTDRRNEQQEVRWHMLQMLSRMRLTASQRECAFELALASTDSRSRIVAAEALFALLALSQDDASLRDRAVETAQRSLGAASPAVRARARKLLSNSWPANS